MDNGEIIVPVAVRYAIWPGSEWVLVEATAKEIGVGMWITDQRGRSSELRPFVFGMFRRER